MADFNTSELDGPAEGLSSEEDDPGAEERSLSADLSKDLFNTSDLAGLEDDMEDDPTSELDGPESLLLSVSSTPLSHCSNATHNRARKRMKASSGEESLSIEDELSCYPLPESDAESASSGNSEEGEQ